MLIRIAIAALVFAAATAPAFAGTCQTNCYRYGNHGQYSNCTTTCP